MKSRTKVFMLFMYAIIICVLLSSCNSRGSEVTTDCDTLQSPVTSAIPNETTGPSEDLTTDEVTTDEVSTDEVTTDEETTSDDTTTEVTTDEVIPETTVAPEVNEAYVYLYGADGSARQLTVKPDSAILSAEFEAFRLPESEDGIKAELKGFEYSLEKDGERKPYDLENPPIVTADGMHVYPVIEYSCRVRFLAGEGCFENGTVTEFYVKSGSSVKLSELLNDMPYKAEDKEYTYPLVGFDFGGKIQTADSSLTVDSPIELIAVYGKTEIEYTVIVHTEYGKLPEGGKTFVFKGDYKACEAFVESYKNYSFEEVRFDNAIYSFNKISLVRDGTEWNIELMWDCTILRYAVTFDHLDGNDPMIIYISAGDKIVLPEDKRREDEIRYYNFVGWRDTNGYLYNGGYEYTVTGEMLFKAEYIPGALKVYTVVFDTEIGTFANGSPDVVIKGYYGDPLTPPEPPALSELTFGEVVYQFVGWDKEVSSVFTDNVTYTAIYTTPKPVYRLNFFIDGELWMSVPHYESVVLVPPERPEFTKGRIFSGWTDLPSVMPACDLDIHSSTRAAEVVYMLDGDVVSRTEAKVGSLVILAAPAQKYGHTVSGWSTADIDSIKESSFIMPERDVCFKAESSPNPHTVNYILDGITVYSDKVVFGDIYTIRGIEVKTGYEFTGWKIQDSSVNADTGVISIPDNDIVFVGGFSLCSYSVNYYVDGILLYTDTYKFGENVTVRPLEEQEGCTFDWSSASVNILSGSFRMPDGDVDIHGVFSDGDNKLVLIIDGKEYGTVGVRAGKTVNVSFYPSKIGYTFTGWNSDDVDTSPGEFIMPEGDVVLRGSFIPNVHTVTLLDMSGDVVMGISQLDFGSVFSLGDRVYYDEGKISVGWVLLSGDAVQRGDMYVMPDEDVIFGIVWDECLTVLIEEDHWIPYYAPLYDEFAGCRYDDQTKTLYISDPSFRVAGSSEGITVVLEYEIP